MHGCFWHGHDCRFFRIPAGNAEFWKAKVAQNRKRDAKDVLALREAGWRVCVVRECVTRKPVSKSAWSGTIDVLSSWIKGDEPFPELFDPQAMREPLPVDAGGLVKIPRYRQEEKPEQGRYEEQVCHDRAVGYASFLHRRMGTSRRIAGSNDPAPQGDSDRVREYEAQNREVIESRQPLFIAKHPGHRFEKSPGWFQTTKVPYRRPGTKKIALLGVTVDITDLKNAEQELEASERRYRHLAQHDQLSGLPNRALLFDRFDQALSLSRREHAGLALLFIDPDKFKKVNDSLGHDAGDQVLRETASRMNACIRESDSAGRTGGDEFVVFLRGAENIHAAELAAEKLRSALDAPFLLSGRKAHISASIGIALFPEHGSSSVELAQRADAAMYRSKAWGRNRFSVYDPALDGDGNPAVKS